MLLESKERTVRELKESQKVRLYEDLLILVPVLAIVAAKGSVNVIDRILLSGIAVGTLIYNVKNYIKNERKNSA